MGYNDALSKYDAQADWNRARRKALYQDVVCHFKTCSLNLLSFEDVRKHMHLTQKIDRGVQEIPLDHIRGSVGRYDDFTAEFLPKRAHLQERWQQVNMAMRAGDTPPIEVFQIGDAYFVLDGNHRVSIAKQEGVERIEAYVWEYPLVSVLDPDADINALLLDSEHRAFLERYGDARPEVRDIVFTCPDQYGELAEMIEQYRRQLEATKAAPATHAQAASAWYEDAYAPALSKMRQDNLLVKFPNRTEADLFLWAWKNNQELEEMARREGFPPASMADS
ncbi:MAG: hypothetical protein ACK2UO_21945 [Caldilineaceae bacterium]